MKLGWNIWENLDDFFGKITFFLDFLTKSGSLDNDTKAQNAKIAFQY